MIQPWKDLLKMAMLLASLLELRRERETFPHIRVLPKRDDHLPRFRVRVNRRVTVGVTRIKTTVVNNIIDSLLFTTPS